MHKHRKQTNQRGVTLVSLMVALAIGLILLAGLIGIWYQTRQTFGAQSNLAQLQDNERMAMTILANTIQSGGYFPIYLNYAIPAVAAPFNRISAFPPSGIFAAAGQFVGGTPPASAGSDNLSVRYMADAGTLNCLGQTDPSGSIVINQFSVTSTGNLQCQVADGTTQTASIGAQTLISGVSSFKVLYGVDTLGDGSAHQYMTASQIAAGQWVNVRSVQITLILNNPLYGGPGQPAVLPAFTRTIAITQST